MSAAKTRILRITTVPMSLMLQLADQPAFLAANGFDVHLLSSPGKEWDKINKGAWNMHCVKMHRAITPFRDVISLWHICKVIWLVKPHIVHTHSPKAGLLGMLAAKICGVPIRIHTLAGTPMATANGLTRWLLKQMEKLTYACSHEVWVNANTLRNWVVEQKMIKPTNAIVLLQGSSNGVDVEKFSIDRLNDLDKQRLIRKLGFSEDAIIWLAISRVVHDKGYDELLSAFEQLYPFYPNVRLVVIGPIEQGIDPISRQSASILKNHPGILHIEWSDEIPVWLSLADGLIHASYREGFPNVLLEAGAAGCPVLVSNIKGNIDLISNTSLGTIFQVKDTNDLLNAMKRWLENPEDALVAAKQLKMLVSHHYDRKKMHQAILNRYLYWLERQAK